MRAALAAHPCSGARAGAPLRRVALSPLWVKLAELQLRFLLASCLAGAFPVALAATLAAGCRALARPFSALAEGASLLPSLLPSLLGAPARGGRLP